MSMSLANPSQAEAPPHGLKELIPYTYSWSELWPKLLWVFLAIALLALVYVLWRRFRGEKAKPREENAFLVLERRLAQMLPPEPFEGKRAREYFFDLNMIFREVIELSSHIPATDLTLQELKEPLRLRSQLSRDVVEDLIKFLERSEYIKFAGIVADPQEAKQSHAQVLQWVSYLRPRHTEQEDN